MGSYYWIKVYHEVLHDPKMGRLSDHLWRRFFELCLIAGEEESEGWLPSVGDMAWTLRCTPSELEADLMRLRDEGLVHENNAQTWWCVTKFSERQAPLSDAERKAKQRERDRQRDYERHGPVTQGVTNRDTEQSRVDIESESEQSRAESEGVPSDDDAVQMLVQFGMDQPRAVLKETKLTPKQVIDTTTWAQQEGKGAGLLRTILRNNEAHRPRAPDNGGSIAICPTCYTHPCTCEEQ